MNGNKFCFIICTNDSFWLAECEKYISKLIVPEGFEVELLAIEEARSMTAGYNEGMHASDAKYKIYLHQDVFIVNPYFLQDLLTIFQADPTIGMVGMVGTVKMPCTFIMWNGNRVGKIYGKIFAYDDAAEQAEPECPYVSCEAVDGLLIATAYDLEWREDLLDGWDFYDVSQSYEFRRKGYQVVVPKMQEAWVVHDDGLMNLSRYNRYRHIAMDTYGRDSYPEEYAYSDEEKQLLIHTEKEYQGVVDSASKMKEQIKEQETKMNQILSLPKQECYEAYLKAMNDPEMEYAKIQDTRLHRNTIIQEAIQIEQKRGVQPYICKFQSLEEMDRNYQKLIFLLRRIRFADLFSEAECMELVEWIEIYQISGYFLLLVLRSEALGNYAERSLIAQFLSNYYVAKEDSFFSQVFLHWN